MLSHLPVLLSSSRSVFTRILHPVYLLRTPFLWSILFHSLIHTCIVAASHPWHDTLAPHRHSYSHVLASSCPHSPFRLLARHIPSQPHFSSSRAPLPLTVSSSRLPLFSPVLLPIFSCSRALLIPFHPHVRLPTRFIVCPRSRPSSHTSCAFFRSLATTLPFTLSSDRTTSQLTPFYFTRGLFVKPRYAKTLSSQRLHRHLERPLLIPVNQPFRVRLRRCLHLSMLFLGIWTSGPVWRRCARVLDDERVRVRMLGACTFAVDDILYADARGVAAGEPHMSLESVCC
ncbi:hypothetical protein BC629DRAFT_1073671 [Irpex lacteus]|nr:hypothetical protein BC629DRAFT_1073671 [Irpex lacteus]